MTLGGDMYTSSGAGIGLTDIIGVVVAFFVLTITFRSLLAAGMPLLTAILGVATTLAGDLDRGRVHDHLLDHPVAGA